MKSLTTLSPRPLSMLLALALLGAASSAAAQSQNFQLGVWHAVVFTPFFPNGMIDSTPPYTMCRNNNITLRLRYTWLHPFQEQVRTDPIGTFYPYFFVQGISPNPVFLPAAQPGNPVVRTVDVGMITGPVNTVGTRTVTFRGQGIFDPTLTASTNVLIETQFEPSSTRYREIAPGTMDMPTQPWFGWTGDLAATSYRLDVAQCSNQSAAQPLTDCGSSNMPFSPLTTTCDGSQYCWVGTPPFHQTASALLPDTNYEYRVHGRNQCGVSEEVGSTPRRVIFRTAQACFTNGGFIPDGGFAEFNAATLANPGSSIVNLRVTTHIDHPRVSDLRISLSKISPDPRGPVVLLEPITTGGNCDARRIQAAFGAGGSFAPNSCRVGEPALAGKLSPAQSLSAFEVAPATLNSGNWRLRVEDTVANGQAGSLREWCLSADILLAPTAYVEDNIWGNGFE